MEIAVFICVLPWATVAVGLLMALVTLVT